MKRTSFSETLYSRHSFNVEKRKTFSFETLSTENYCENKSNLVTKDLLDELAKRLVLRLELLRLLLLLGVFPWRNS